jgi:hypothetical protein
MFGKGALAWADGEIPGAVGVLEPATAGGGITAGVARLGKDGAIELAIGAGGKVLQRGDIQDVDDLIPGAKDAFALQVGQDTDACFDGDAGAVGDVLASEAEFDADAVRMADAILAHELEEGAADTAARVFEDSDSGCDIALAKLDAQSFDDIPDGNGVELAELRDCRAGQECQSDIVEGDSGGGIVGAVEGGPEFERAARGPEAGDLVTAIGGHVVEADAATGEHPEASTVVTFAENLGASREGVSAAHGSDGGNGIGIQAGSQEAGFEGRNEVVARPIARWCACELLL